MSGMRVAVGADDAGFAYKEAIRRQLEADDRVDAVIDLGVHSGGERSATYGEIGLRAGEEIAAGRADRAVLVCGTGIGMAIAANKVAGVRATVAHDTYSAERSILSNNCQVLALGQRVIGQVLALRIVDEWLDYRFDPSSPSGRKVAVISDYEDR